MKKDEHWAQQDGGGEGRAASLASSGRWGRYGLKTNRTIMTSEIQFGPSSIQPYSRLFKGVFLIQDSAFINLMLKAKKDAQRIMKTIKDTKPHRITRNFCSSPVFYERPNE